MRTTIAAPGLSHRRAARLPAPRAPPTRRSSARGRSIPPIAAPAQENQNAPLVIAKDRYDQHESHCTFKSVDGKDSDWKIGADCTVEGSATPYDFTLTVSGDTLTFTDSGGARDFLRCK